MAAEVKEVKEVVVAANELALVILANLKLGVVGEFEAVFSKIMGDAAFKSMMAAAFEGMKAIPDELKAIDLHGGLELAETQIAYIPKLVAALKG